VVVERHDTHPKRVWKGAVAEVSFWWYYKRLTSSVEYLATLWTEYFSR
jgi:hypothetical protein